MAKHITEIFETNPQLLETKEIKELIQQFKEQFLKIQKDKNEYKEKVTDLLIHSNFYLKEGLSDKDIIKELIEISF